MRGFYMGLGAIALQVAAVSGHKYGEQYSNTTVIGSQGLVTSSIEMTTQTVYATKVRTITSCKPEVTNCPAGGHHVTTETIAISTTVCPVSEADKTKPTTTPTPTQFTTSTVYMTNVRTITSCPPQVPNCPGGTHVTTETIALSTTVCPVTESHPPKTLVTQNPPHSQPPKPQPSAKTTAVGTGSFFPPTLTGTAPIGLPTAAAGRVGSGMAGVAAGVLIAALL
ncbi:hypothetical protein D7B24_001114 [Verticillium nonalfalfae]|uniref:GPI anchored serine-rich protein n=1 Tax=Verticillium nonalfalfae TaxID=1051616 RepID=A0A3M9YJB1_9PEZI|nr:uncharacterized protein D7B24_001114 [Verticillium nonalfalfae]RNJ59876.1 hypothetical protein D7B24_001114 [Verticillium nonalfalfae]